MTKYGMWALLALVASYLIMFALVAEQVKASTWAIVALFVLLLLPFVGIAVGLFWLQGRTPRPQPRREEQPRGDVIDTTWRIEEPRTALLPEPYRLQPAPRTTVPVQSFNGRSPGQRAAEMVLTTPIETEDGKREDIECSVSVLQKAAAILSEGAQPTRASFNAQGVMSSVEISGAVAFLRTHGWIAAGAKGTPARWADGLSAEHAEQLQEWLSQWGR